MSTPAVRLSKNAPEHKGIIKIIEGKIKIGERLIPLANPPPSKYQFCSSIMLGNKQVFAYNYY